MNDSHPIPQPAPEANSESLLKAYEEICTSYHAIDEFRTRLLGFLPLSSLVGIFLLDPTKMVSATNMQPNELFGFASLFAALLTLALFGYEIRGMRRTHTLIAEGFHLEQQLGIIHGQFHVCSEKKCPDELDDNPILKFFNSKLIACFIYSTVFVAWSFISLRLGAGYNTLTCAISASVAGILMGLIVFVGVRKLHAA
jgi:hypothetical protein